MHDVSVPKSCSKPVGFDTNGLFWAAQLADFTGDLMF